MENMNPIFSLKNFRSFGENGADFELAPITVLTGCNSAGKSSLVKALVLLGKNAKGYSNSELLPSFDLKASSFDLKLGGYNNIVHSLNKEGEMEFSYTIWSSILNEEVICRRIYKEGFLKDGSLKFFSIEKKDGVVIYRVYLKPEPVVNIDGSEGYIEDVHDEDLEHFESIRVNYEKYMLTDGYKKLCSYVNEKYSNLLTEEKKEKKKKKIYYSCIIHEIISPWFINEPISIDSSTNNIRRLYSVEDKDKLSVLLNQIVSQCPSYTYHSDGYVDSWLKKFQIGDSLEIEGFEEGLGVCVFVMNGGEGRLLADEGCGLTQIISLLLQINILIDRKRREVLADIFPERICDRNGYKKTLICIEEPEVHLHPKYQSLLADLFVEAYKKYNIHFIIETHSEYLIRKLQVLVADKENELSSNEVSLNYVEKDENGVSTNRKIEILEDGRLSEPFGPGFFDESKSLVMQMLKF